LYQCNFELFLVIFKVFNVKKVTCLCISMENQPVFCLLSFIGVGFVLWRLWQRWHIINEWRFWDKLGWLFVFVVYSCSGVGDGVRLIRNGNKKWVVKKLNINLLLLFSWFRRNLKMVDLCVCFDYGMNAHNPCFL